MTIGDRVDAACQRLRDAGWNVADALNGEPFLDISTLGEALDSGATARLPFRGAADELQLAFAREGLALRTELEGRPDDDDWGVEGESSSGLAVFDSKANSSHLISLVTALDDLKKRGYVAEPALGETHSDGWDMVRTGNRGDKVLFWTRPAHRAAFDDDGSIIDRLRMQWVGDKDEIAKALSSTGLDVRVPKQDDEAFEVRPRP